MSIYLNIKTASVVLLFSVLGPLTIAKEAPQLTPPPASLELDGFYKKHISADGVPIVGSELVSDKALMEAKRIVTMMMAKDARLSKQLIKNKVRVAIMAQSEKTTDIPEHSDLTPKAYWDKRARGLGATHERPATSGAEENLLKLPKDHYHGENILLHEFAHTLHLMAIVDLDPKFNSKLEAAYKAAISKGLWKETYAATNSREYWAEGVQSWFNVNRQSTPPNGVHNHINTHEELKEYDPALYSLIELWFNAP